MKINKKEWATGASRVWLGSVALILRRRATIGPWVGLAQRNPTHGNLCRSK